MASNVLQVLLLQLAGRGYCLHLRYGGCLARHIRPDVSQFVL
jgi:hypothetical protein